MENTTKVLSVKDFMIQTKLCRNSVYVGIRSGQIPSVRIGRRILIPADAIDRMLKSEGKEKANIAQSIGR